MGVDVNRSTAVWGDAVGVLPAGRTARASRGIRDGEKTDRTADIGAETVREAEEDAGDACGAAGSLAETSTTAPTASSSKSFLARSARVGGGGGDDDAARGSGTPPLMPENSPIGESFDLFVFDGAMGGVAAAATVPPPATAAPRSGTSDSSGAQHDISKGESPTF